MKGRRRKRLDQQMSLPDVPRIQPKFSMLGRDDCLRIHQASCDILRQTGVRVYCKEAIDLLQGAGADVKDNLVKFSPSLVEWVLASAPGPFNLYKRGTSEVAIKLDGKGVYFGPGSDTFRYLDPRSGERRDYVLSDIADCARLIDALP